MSRQDESSKKRKLGTPPGRSIFNKRKRPTPTLKADGFEIELADFSMFYKVFGPPLDAANADVETFIFIHGAPGLVDHRMYEDFWSQFVTENRRLILINQRGSGLSSGADNLAKCNIQQHARDLNSFCETLDIKKPIIGGLSQGGYVAIATAEQFPDLPAGLVITNTEAKRDTDIRQAATLRVAKEYFGKSEAEARELSQLVEASDADWCGVDYTPLLKLYSKNHYRPEELARCVKHDEVWRQFMSEEFPTFNLTPGLNKITCPVVYLVGEHDCVHPLASAEQTRAGMVNATVQFEVLPTADPIYRDEPELSRQRVEEGLDWIKAQQPTDTSESAAGGGATCSF